MTCGLIFKKVAGSLQRKEEIEGFVEEITEKIKPLLTDELSEEIKQLYEVDPKIYFKVKVLFVRVYVKNPLRVSKYTELKPPQLLRVKYLNVVGTPLKYTTIHEHKTNATSGSAKVSFHLKNLRLGRELLMIRMHQDQFIQMTKD